MPIDLMMSLVLLIEAVEKRLADERNEGERGKLLVLLRRMDLLLEKCLAGCFAERDLLAGQAQRELNSARRKALRWRRNRARWGELPAEISAVLDRMDEWVAEMGPGN